MIAMKTNFIKKALDWVSNTMDTPFFAMFLVVLELVCYYLGLDLVVIWTISACITFTYAYKKNMNSILVVFLFMCTMISLKNSPGNNHSWSETIVDYYYRPVIYINCIVAVAIPAVTIVCRCIYNLATRKIDFNLSFIATIILCLAFMSNGMFRGEYNNMDRVFGLFMVFFFFFLFYATAPAVSINKKSIRTIALQAIIFSLVPIVEMVVFFITHSFSFESRPDVFLGWGNRNTVGMLLIVVMCFNMYLCRYETNKVIKGLNHLLFLVLAAIILLTFSRQSLLGLIFLVEIYCLAMIIKHKDKERIKFIGYTVLWTVVSGGFLAFFIGKGFMGDISEDGRVYLYKQAIKAFLSYPIFGKGFYFIGYDPAVQLSSVMPYACHDTLLEMLGACGAFGFVAYVFYRVTTSLDIHKNITTEKIYPLIGLSAFLGMSLIDIHIFDLLGTSVYVAILAMCMADKEKKASE